MVQNNQLPEGTDTIIGGASGGTTTGGTTDMGSDALIVGSTTGSNGSDSTDSGDGDWRQSLRSGSERLTGQASDKARDVIGQGLERSAEALSNVSRMIGDTASGIDERLGSEYGDYARRAAGTIEDIASSLASKQPEELIDDTRNFVRKSPGVALAGAAVVGFALTRLIKNGLTPDDDGSSTRSDSGNAPPRTTSAD